MKGKTGVSNRRLLITKNSIMMLVMLVIIFLAIFAWYFINKNVSATGISVKAAQPDEVQIAITENGADTGIFGNYVTTNNTTSFVAGHWSDSATFDGPFQFSNDVTSDGLTFINPGFSSTEDNDDAKADARTNGKIVNLNAIPTVAKSNLYTFSQSEIDSGAKPEYYSVPFYLRSKNSDLYVKPSAYLAMGVETTSGEVMTGSSSTRKSAYGNFTSDALVAAMRVSLTGGPISEINDSTHTATNPSKYESSFVWVPRPDLFLTIPSGTSEDDWTLLTGVTKTTQGSNSADSTTYKSGFTRLGTAVDPGTTFKHNYYTYRYVDPEAASPVVNGVSYVEDPSTDNTYTPLGGSEELPSNAYKSDVTKTTTLTNGTVPTLGEGKKISEFSTTPTKIGDYYYYKYYINLWIEGTDTEARRAMDTGKFSLYIEFGNSG